MRFKFKERRSRILSICITAFMLVGMLPFGTAVFADGDLSTDKVQVDSFKIIDEANANMEVDYVTDADAGNMTSTLTMPTILVVPYVKTRRTVRLSCSLLHRITVQKKSMKGIPWQLRLLMGHLQRRPLLRNSLKTTTEMSSEHISMIRVYLSLHSPVITSKTML